MWWKKQVKAGVLIYALLMVAVFSLLLQFYLNRQVAVARTHKAGEQALIAYSMAHLTKEKVEVGLKKAEEKKAKEAQEAKAQALPQENQSKEQELVDASTPAKITEENADEGDTSGDTLAQTKEGEAPTSLLPTETQADQANKVASQAPADNPKIEEHPAEQANIEGQLSYNHGQTSYQLKDDILTVEVRLTTGKIFHYKFHIDSEKP